MLNNHDYYINIQNNGKTYPWWQKSSEIPKDETVTGVHLLNEVTIS